MPLTGKITLKTEINWLIYLSEFIIQVQLETKEHFSKY